MAKTAALAATLLSALLGAGAAHAYDAVVSTAPPPARHERAHGTWEGHVWATGHYELRHHRYVWVTGHWIKEREGYAYRQPEWVQRRNGDWVMVGGTWDRVQARGPKGDLDHDGIANRDDHDKDGDGVRNGRDRFPGNDRRS